MVPHDAIDLGREAILTAFLIGAPILLVGTAVGLVIGLLQALTQIQDQTVSFVPKILAMVVALGVCLPWIVYRKIEYSEQLIQSTPQSILGG